jgi:hypothetical protein
MSEPGQISSGPAGLTTAAGGTALTARENSEEVPEPQELTPLTLIIPVTANEENETTIELVPAPLVMEAPAGSIQLYELAPLIRGTEKV